MARRATVATTIRETRKAWRRLFLAAYSEGATVTDACAAAGVQRARFYRARDRSPAFAKAFAEAQETAADLIRREVRRRGIDGWVDGDRHLYDGNLLAKLAQARCAEFRPAPKDANVTVNTTTNLTVTISAEKLAEYQQREKAALEALGYGRN